MQNDLPKHHPLIMDIRDIGQTIIPNNLFDDYSVVPTEKYFYFLLFRKYGEDFTLDDLALAMGCDTERLIKYLQNLEDVGWLQLVQDSDGSKRIKPLKHFPSFTEGKE